MSSSIVKLYGIRPPTKKQVERQKWVARFTAKNQRPPTYKEIATRFNISIPTAWETMQRVEKNTKACHTCGRDY